MQKYKYTAVDLEQRKFRGHFLAESVEDLRLQLLRQNLYLVKALPESDKPLFALLPLGSKVRMRELTTFCRQFSIMITAGISILDSIFILKEQSFAGFFQRTLSRVYEDVKAGSLLSEAMEQHPRIFPRFFTSMIYVGEQSGSLDQVLASCADYYERDASIRGKTRSAMAYPMLLVAMVIAIVCLMVLFVVPTFETALKQLELELPPLTQGILDFSHWFGANWAVLILGILAGLLLLVLAGKLPPVKLVYDTLLLWMPVFGGIQRDLISARFARGFGLLLSGGMDMVESLNVIQRVLGNKSVERRFALAARDVAGGKSLAEALTERRVFPSMLIQMVSVGEKSGSIDDVLLRSGSYFDDQVERSLTTMTTLLQPVLLVILGSIVGVMFYAIYAPMLRLMEML